MENSHNAKKVNLFLNIEVICLKVFKVVYSSDPSCLPGSINLGQNGSSDIPVIVKRDITLTRHVELRSKHTDTVCYIFPRRLPTKCNDLKLSGFYNITTNFMNV